VKHAGAAALDVLEPVLAAVRDLSAATERSRGVFYAKGRAVLHFHEDAAGLFADVRLDGPDGCWSRLRVSTAAERRRFLAGVRRGWSQVGRSRPA
jgi:hypothetical protein